MSLFKHTFKRVEHLIAAPRDPHEEEQARLQENLFYTNLSSLQPKTNVQKPTVFPKIIRSSYCKVPSNFSDLSSSL